ncbi:hypothetical protein OI18_21930 [Flavihumibacter solisilvae]|uniref:Uncharacterized protein n=2 Tax=Flavihumibacter solisilvae TaxID=1349421 RepID=A0A0C1IEQ1_9BACT|nr:hypothetical protein OI18_21930 [Flavihumibacter solisilvae]
MLFSVSVCFSQDTITKRSGEDMRVKVLEVNQSDIKYKKYDNLEGPTFSLLKSEIVMIRYSNGTRDMFIDEPKNVELKPYDKYSREDLYHLGQSDASKHYKGYKGAGGGTLITGLVSPLLGLIPAITCSTTTPKDSNLNYPSAELMNKPDYFNGYTKKAKSIKSGKVWKNWGIAFGVNLVAVLVLTASGQ